MNEFFFSDFGVDYIIHNCLTIVYHFTTEPLLLLALPLSLGQM